MMTFTESTSFFSQEIMQVAGKVQSAVQARPELQLLGDPVLSVVGVVIRLVSG